ncbi:hypothetical protein LOAG_11572 [Loa loa]|uniref:Cysteine-rich and transmembrane domain-containing protein WIH2-like n=1 Tax=Loa loa TaxID=7209 RepID=A0A1I7V8M0_LOALO|nr:hypothetical protein LOAG_11572 [Loa loa]EFO16932.1 hypothetical protein LOAG_11572 [Loa loa]
MSHKLVKRQCSCQPSSCRCTSIQLVLQISCFCPQTCKCPSPIPPPYHPPITYPIPTTTLPPVTYTLPPITPVPVVPVGPTQSPYCCILFICASCGSYGGTYGGLQPSSQYSPPSSQYYLPPSTGYQYPPQSPSVYQYPVVKHYQLPTGQTSYGYPTTTSTCSIGFTICLGGSFCCKN